MREVDILEISLQQLKEGACGVVTALHCTGPMRRRMLDIGLVENTPVRCLQSGPSGDPVAYEIRGAVMALRNEDAAQVWVRPQAKPERGAELPDHRTEQE